METKTARKRLPKIEKRIRLIRQCEIDLSKRFADGVAARLQWDEISRGMFGRIGGVATYLSDSEVHRLHGWIDAYREYAIRALVEWRKHFRGQLVTSEEIPRGAWHEVVTDLCAYTYKGEPEHVFMGVQAKSETALAQLTKG